MLLGHVVPVTATGATRRDLAAELVAHRDELRPPSVVMSPEHLGAAHQTRFSFARSLLRRMARDSWTVERTSFDLDAEGRGEAIYRVDAGGHDLHFVAFTTTLDEATHTDRVVADAWEVTCALVDSDPSGTFLDDLRRSVPLQEHGRLDSRVLVLARGNRSVRFYEHLVDRLASGLQPEATEVADADYIMRSTAFYGNGKFGMRSFLGYPDDHPLRAAYRAQFLAAWLFRELSYDSVEHCARARGGAGAVPFDGGWRRYFGLGNATGLGLVPFAFRHPAILNAWAGIRELALAGVRAAPGTPERLAELTGRLDRAHAHYSALGGPDRPPWLGPSSLALVVERTRERLEEVADRRRPFDALYRWAEEQDVETCELVASMLVDLDDRISDDEADSMLLVDEEVRMDPATTVDQLRQLLADGYGWLDGLGLDDTGSDHYWWVVSDNTDEPRRAVRRELGPGQREVPIGVALQLGSLRQHLEGLPGGMRLATVLADHPEHAPGARRLLGSGLPYGEPRDNACRAGFLPLQLQRFQLAAYGMDNYSPKSTDWLRVTLFQGAPRVADLGSDPSDDWIRPPRPDRGSR